MRIALVLLAACGAAPANPTRCATDVVLLRAARDCNDMRGGHSGYWEMQIVDGPRRGETLIAFYGESAPTFQLANWSIATPDFTATAAPKEWPNSCSQVSHPPAYAGVVGARIEGYPRETEARAAFAKKRCAN